VADREQHQAAEEMLREVPDDPAGLLRQRFLLQHLRRTGQLP
jgi:Ca-activated chloride channel family protein